MVTIKILGMEDVKLSSIEFDAMVQALRTMVKWESGGMYGDGAEISDKAGYAQAKRILKKLNYY